MKDRTFCVYNRDLDLYMTSRGSWVGIYEAAMFNSIGTAKARVTCVAKELRHRYKYWGDKFGNISGQIETLMGSEILCIKLQKVELESFQVAFMLDKVSG